MFVSTLNHQNFLSSTATITVELCGSLGATGKGHGTDKGVILGLMGYKPDTCDPNLIEETLKHVRTSQSLSLLGMHEIRFLETEHVIFLPEKTMVEHPNGLRFQAFGDDGKKLHETSYLSVGGGFVVEAGSANVPEQVIVVTQPYPFRSGDDLMMMCEAYQLSVSDLMMANEAIHRPEQQTKQELLCIWQAMRECVERGIHNGGTLPGPLQIKRRAPKLFRDLTDRHEQGLADDLSGMDWLNLYAMAVNEENAAGGRVVTAPTNGAAGILPAVLHYYVRSSRDTSNQTVINFLLTAAAIGIVYKLNASISGAEVGCQGEVGVACSMAAGALCAILGGTPRQVENAAEIGMEHNLGLTCDPVGGLVQIPCIERNAIGAAKAVNAARMALRGDGTHFISLDAVIKTMHETGRDMHVKYKETSKGGLAVNIVEC